MRPRPRGVNSGCLFASCHFYVSLHMYPAFGQHSFCYPCSYSCTQHPTQVCTHSPSIAVRAHLAVGAAEDISLVVVLGHR